MSLAPYWLSNLFGAFFFMGAFLTGLTMMGIMMVYWRGKLGMREVIGREQFHDLGKLVFGFSVFWAYLMFSQLLVIWYGNLREETSFVFYRMWGEWQPDRDPGRSHGVPHPLLGADLGEGEDHPGHVYAVRDDQLPRRVARAVPPRRTVAHATTVRCSGSRRSARCCSLAACTRSPWRGSRLGTRCCPPGSPPTRWNESTPTSGMQGAIHVR